MIQGAALLVNKDFNLTRLPPENERLFIEAVKATIATHAMFAHGDRVLVGVSGGPDSIALLDVLFRLAPELGISLGVIHLNHGLRGDESDEDARFVAAVAARLKLPLFSDQADVAQFQRRHGLSVEEAGRRLRYAFYNEVAQKNGWSKITLGHHLDDNAELVLMFLLRGSGLQGLAGIPPVRDQKFARPFIDRTRTEILAYIESRGIDFRTDASNQDVHYRRNRIRHQLIPELETYNPKITHNLVRLANIARADNQWLETISREWFDNWTVGSAENEIRLPLTELAQIPLAAQRRLYRLAFKSLKGDLRRLSYEHVAAIGRLLPGGHAGKGVDLPGNIRVSISSRYLHFRQGSGKGQHIKGNPEKKISYQYTLQSPGEIELKAIGATLNCTCIDHIPPDILSATQHTAYVDAAKAPFPIAIRNMEPGDRFQPSGMSGTQKIKKYFIDRKVDRQDRHRYPVVLSRDRIIWLAGLRMDEKAKATRSSGKVLKLEFFLP
jgi:tRNA(Ile)-lysidine synthase